jgi:hypothetical protein
MLRKICLVVLVIGVGMFSSCNKKLQMQIDDLNERLDSLNTNIAGLSLTKLELENKISELELNVSDFNNLYDNPFIGCWYSDSTALFGVIGEIQIYPGGLGSLDFGRDVYQVFSWSEIDGIITFHFGDVLFCGCFGIDLNELFGEMFEEDQFPVIEINETDESESFYLSDWRSNEITFKRCIIN